MVPQRGRRSSSGALPILNARSASGGPAAPEAEALRIGEVALPATPRQIAYARSLALRNQTLLPWEIQQDRRSLSAWIDAQAQMKPLSELDSLPSSKQVAFAERLARIKRRAVPDECFRDKGLMSKWIDGNK